MTRPHSRDEARPGATGDGPGPHDRSGFAFAGVLTAIVLAVLLFAFL